MAEQDQDKTEQATAFKLKEARKKGQVSKSMELNSFALLLTGLSISYLLGSEIFGAFMRLNAKIFNHAGQAVFSDKAVVTLYGNIAEGLLDAFIIFTIAIIVVSVLINFIQTGPIFTFHPIKPDIERINPVAGFKRVFSIRMLFDFLKTVIKISLFGSVAYFSIKALLPDLIMLIDINTSSYGVRLLGFTNSLIAKLLIVLFFIALIDIVFVRRDFGRKMMMSRRELKDEVKRRDGDPRVKSKLRELQREAVKRAGALRKVPEADILITNPTHLSVALAYDREKMNAPVVLAKGAGDLAVEMRKVARRHNIPIYENKILARALFRKVDIDNYIPDEHFRTIAKLLILAYRLKNNAMNVAPNHV